MNIGYITDFNIDNFYRKQTKIPKNTKNIDGYIPKNNKCFIFPYNYIELSNNSGAKINLKYEMFDDLNSKEITFNYYPVVSSTPNLFVTPIDYQGKKNNFDYAISFNNFPQLPWNYDYFKNWSALNANSLSFSFISDTINTGMNLFTGNIPGLISSASNQIGKYMSMRDKENTPLQTRGLPQGNALLYSGGAGVYAYHICSKKEYISIIDDYFSCFGYLVNEIKIPNLKSRPSFNYIQTENINISGTFPEKDKEKLCQIFNEGVTIWHNPKQFGDFNVANPPQQK